MNDLSTSKPVFGVRIEPWAESDLPLLVRLNIPEMLDHLGGTETEDQVHNRHKRYKELKANGKGCMFSIILLPENIAVGNVGFWETEWQGEPIYEMGWGVLPPYQGQGIAAIATAAAISTAKDANKHRFLHAFPAVDNPASNAICRKLEMEWVAECSFEYPPGTFMRCNDWRFKLNDKE
ncbi:GNAT family N-acetyltransferase [Paenibacillus sp. HWE-109]|uniref:GNAT family N-acetyltransferase n=1 Tax=Paenibacillus sp. HWE-109 TaxID=1306526 RepID=UPI001EDCAD48|nr:GNAT family N-acetyltransferase [Paenibacillus sp. HWE-109]UKS29203.1 GNAT family N-acetyltransferase [Paenibacillus sp. HWE-109]